MPITVLAAAPNNVVVKNWRRLGWLARRSFRLGGCKRAPLCRQFCRYATRCSAQIRRSFAKLRGRRAVRGVNYWMASCQEVPAYESRVHAVLDRNGKVEDCALEITRQLRQMLLQTALVKRFRGFHAGVKGESGFDGAPTGLRQSPRQFGFP